MADATDTYDEALDLVDVNSGDIYTDIVSGLEEEVGEALYPGDERRIFGEALVAVLVAYISKANDASRQTLLRYARGQVLDAIGERLNVERIAPVPARCDVRFDLSAPQARTITIPAMTKVTSDGSIYFATVSPAVIQAGETTVTAPCECTVAGESGNGVPAGAMSTLVDLIPYVGSVANVDESHGGDDGEPYTAEGDDRFRERIRIAPSTLSTAGPEQGYVYWAMSADADIADVAAFSEEFDDERTLTVSGGAAYMGGDLLEPQELLTVDGSAEGFTWSYQDSLLKIMPADEKKTSIDVRVHRRMDGRVKVVPLMAGGALPDEDVIKAVYAAVNDKTVRPMTDVVTVEAPTEVEYGIDITYWTTVEEEAAVVAAVEGSGGAIDSYVEEQRAKLGRDINPDVLKTYVMRAGAIRCDVRSPVHTPVLGTQVAKLASSKASHELETEAGWSE